MPNIEWAIAGFITDKGEMRIGGFSLGGEELFDEPLDLDEMIASLSESNEVSADHRLSPEGRVQLKLVAETLAGAFENIKSRLSDDKEKKEKLPSSDGSKEGDVVSMADKKKEIETSKHTV